MERKIKKMIKVSKYRFDTESQAQSKIDALPSVTDEDGNNVPNHKHTVVKVAKIVLEQGEYDSEGEETKAPVYYNGYHVDCLWKDIEETDEEGNVTVDHPYGWKSYAVDPEEEGAHGFMGVLYQENKI